MRLSTLQAKALFEETEKLLPPQFKGTLILFGSRVVDSLKGGDIDLILHVFDQHQLEQLRLIDFRFVSRFKARKEIGDRRIDLKILGTDELNSPFFEQALENSVILHRWGNDL